MGTEGSRFMGTEFLFGKMKKDRVVGGGDSYATAQTCLTVMVRNRFYMYFAKIC